MCNVLSGLGMSRKPDWDVLLNATTPKASPRCVLLGWTNPCTCERVPAAEFNLFKMVAVRSDMFLGASWECPNVESREDLSTPRIGPCRGNAAFMMSLLRDI